MSDDIDLKAAINAVSDMVQNRPRPIREFDQIYMKTGDIVMQSEFVASWANKKRLAFIGDGDSISVCVAYSYDTVRCHRKHAENDPLIGQPVKPSKLGRRAAEDAAEAAQRKLSPGLESKTVVNTHRMLHRAWEDFAVWGWAKRNVVSDAHPPRVPRKGRKVWTVSQLQRFLQYARSDRFFALWVLEATSGMRRRCELAGARRDLLDLDAGTLAIETTRVVVDGRVIESDGKTENAQHMLAPDPFTLAVLKAHAEKLDQERRDLGPDYHDHGVLFSWEDGRPPHPDTITRRFKQLAAAAGLPEIDLHDVRHSYATAEPVAMRRSTGKRSVSASVTRTWRSP